MDNLILIALLAFVCEFVDSSLGMGYGTTLTPLLLLLGYEPMQVVPVVLTSEIITGLVAAAVHHRYGNAHLDFRNSDHVARQQSRLGRWTGYLPRSRDALVALMLSVFSILGAAFAVIVAVNLSAFAVSLYIAILVIAIGAYILIRHRHTMAFRWPRIIGLGTLAAFNKGISGGGYGPIVTGGQILAGVDGKAAIAIASFSEAIASIAGVTVYVLSGRAIDWVLAPYLIVGAVLSVPLAGLAVRKMDTKRLAFVIGIICLILGVQTLTEVVFS
ncbi:MAG: sulfite exporter TauE/SafE family protein [Candidatus Kerfeldbacteria bacterium]|nr:sulfite exporter TauE/SafE family protein [Candidatus Kerfeldbacteria bacterium]